MKYVDDTFTDTDATALNVHAPDTDRPGGGWTMIAGAWTIDSNTAITTAVANARSVIDSGLADGWFKVDLTIGDALDAAYLVFRSNAAGTNFWIAGLDDTLQEVVLQSAAAMVLTSRASKAYAIDEATAYEVKVVCVGDEIHVYVNDILQISHTAALYNTQEYAGLYSSSNADAVFDDFVVDTRPTCLYCTTNDVKTRLGDQWVAGTDYDEELEEAIEEASRLIDLELGWEDCHFAAADLATVTRYYNSMAGQELQIDRYLDDGGFAVAVDDDADGTYTAWVRDTDYITWPYNADYISTIIIKYDADVYFPTGQALVRVTGRIGEYAEPPAYVRKAVVIIVAKAYKRGRQMFQDTGAVVELGQLTYTLAIDPEVDRILKNIPRRVNFG